MLGRTHALSGAALALGIFTATGVHPAPMEIAAFTIAAAGGGMLPDADHESASVAWSLPPVSRWMCRVVGAASGGHRNGTHSLVGVAAFVAFAVVVQRLGDILSFAGVQHARAALIGQIAMGVWLGFLFAIATSALRLKPPGNKVLWSLMCLTGGVAVGWAGIVWPFNTGMIPVAIGVGAVAHILGDMLTKEGCPLLWPFNRFRFRVATITTDTWPERLIVAPALTISVVALIYLLLPAEWTYQVTQSALQLLDGLAHVRRSLVH